MNLCLITPGGRGERAGNHMTATRWSTHLRKLGHRVTLAHEFRGERTDALIALHAYRSAESIRAFRDRHPDRPLIVAMTGTDLYQYQKTHPEITGRSIDLADRLIVLHDLAYKVLWSVTRLLSERLRVTNDNLKSFLAMSMF